MVIGLIKSYPHLSRARIQCVTYILNVSPGHVRCMDETKAQREMSTSSYLMKRRTLKQTYNNGSVNVKLNMKSADTGNKHIDNHPRNTQGIWL